LTGPRRARDRGWFRYAAQARLDPRILVAAVKYVPDSIDAAADSGELRHALQAGRDVPLGDW